jgi:hypothetical protein
VTSLPYPMRAANLGGRGIIYVKGPGRAHAKNPISMSSKHLILMRGLTPQNAAPLRVVIAFASLPTTILSTPAPAPHLTHLDIRLIQSGGLPTRHGRRREGQRRSAKSKSKLADDPCVNKIRIAGRRAGSRRFFFSSHGPYSGSTIGPV